jgi:branched-chain amino acid transport system permease protein
VREGEILGLVGPNGSGKSTFVNLVSGHYRADGGELIFAGADIAKLDAHRIARAGVARTVPDPATVRALQRHRQCRHSRDVRRRAIASRRGGRRGVALARIHRARDKAQWLPGDLNLHQRKFLELARALASGPKLLLLDEVLSGLTPARSTERSG